MDTQMRLGLDPESLAAPFDRIDRGDMSGVREIDVLMDHPEVISVARFHFSDGVGYEVLFSGAAEEDDFTSAVQWVGKSWLVRCEPWGWSASGYAMTRALYRDLRPPGAYGL